MSLPILASPHPLSPRTSCRATVILGSNLDELHHHVLTTIQSAVDIVPLYSI
jgi:hypothetical protein